jgi:type IV secretion system protein TrbL
MDPGILTTTLQHFISVFSHGWSNLQPAVSFLIKVFLGIEILMFGLWMALGGIDNLASAMKKVLYLLVWAWIIKEFPMLSNAFVQSLVQAGQMAAGGRGANIFDPSSILLMGITSLAPALEELAGAGALLQLGNAITIGLCILMVLLAYVLIAWQIFYAVLEFYLIAALVGLFLPFGFFEPTKFLAEKAIGAIVSSGIKLMVLSFIITIITPVLQTLTFSGDLTLKEAISALLTIGALAFLCWNAPGVAAGLMSGSPSLSAGLAMQNAMSAGRTVAMATAGAWKAGAATIKTVQAATSAAGDLGKKLGGVAGPAAGRAIQQSSKVAGQAVQKAGEGVSAAGHAMRSVGGSIASSSVPIVSQVAGAVVGAAGVATDLAGKGISVAGKGIEKAGEAAGKAAEKTGEAAGKVADKTADATGNTVEGNMKVASTASTASAVPTHSTVSSGAPRSNKDNSSDWAKAMLENNTNNPQDF